MMPDAIARERFGFKVLMVGDVVDCVIGRQFLPNQTGDSIALENRRGGTLTRWDEYGNAVVEWPNGESCSYEPALLVPSRESGDGL